MTTPSRTDPNAAQIENADDAQASPSDRLHARSIENPDQQSSRPSTNPDGTRTAIVAASPRMLGRSMLWSLLLPDGLAQEGVSGRFFLARCGAITEEERATNWAIYRRRPLYGVFQHGAVDPQGVAQWELVMPAQSADRSADPGYHWLAGLVAGTPVNLLGPFGQGFQLEATSRNLLLLADTATVPLLLGLGDQMLDRGGRVTLLLQLEEDEADVTATAAHQGIGAIVEQLPIAVEVRQATRGEQWQAQLAETVPWADQIAVALAPDEISSLQHAIQQNRFRVDAGFAQVFVQADLFCGIGACLACVVPTRDGGYTRACVHGPVFDLMALG